MAAIKCPQCGEKGFTWSIDEEESEFTMWHCSLCGYHCEENEEKEGICEGCGQKREMYLIEEEKNRKYRYCDVCNSKTEN